MAETSGALNTEVKRLIEQGNQLFAKRSSLMSLWQTSAENFYPERADFTVCRTTGEEFAAGLYSSYPIIVRRELGNSFSSMLRRRDQEWFKVGIDRENIDNSGKQWLEWATGVQRRAMYDTVANFVRATKEADQDYAAFGQCVISTEISYERTALLYRCWHLRDIVWREGADGSIGQRHHNVKETAQNLAKQFGKDKLHPKMRECLEKDPHREFNCRRIILPAKEYPLEQKHSFAWVSIYIDLDNEHLIDQRPSATPVYVIPRWQTVSGSQYSFSPAVTAGLPDARLLQAITLTLLEAGENAVRPPMVAVEEALTGGVQLYSGGVTMVDAEYDERLGSALRPAFDNSRGLPYGIEISQEKENALRRAFFIDKLRQMPQKELTAYEASKWTEDWIREAIPLFEPMEDEYNARVCQQTFDDLMRVGAFGPLQDIPQSLRRADVRFTFDSPLSQAIARRKGQKFGEAKALIDIATELDPASRATVDARVALREALEGIGVPAKWMRDEEAVEAHAEQLSKQQQEQEAANQEAQQASTSVDQAKAAESLAKVA